MKGCRDEDAPADDDEGMDTALDDDCDCDGLLILEGCLVLGLDGG